MIHGEQGGNPHIDVNDVLPEGKITQVHVCIVEHENGGEGIYGQVIGGLIVNFVCHSDERREQLHALLVQQGTYEVAKRLGKRIFWRVYRSGE